MPHTIYAFAPKKTYTSITPANSLMHSLQGQLLFLFLSPYITLAFLEHQTHRIILYVLFHVCLLSHSIMCFKIHPCFVTEIYSVLLLRSISSCKCTTLCFSIFLLMFIWVFQFGTIKNKAPEDNFCTQFWTHVFLFVCFLSEISQISLQRNCWSIVWI